VLVFRLHNVSTARPTHAVPLPQDTLAPVSLLHDTTVEVTGRGVSGMRHEGTAFRVAPVVPLVDKPLELGGMERFSVQHV